MLATVDFDNQLSLRASEIEDIWTYWKLPTEAVAVELLSAQSRPQANFSIGHLRAKSASPLDL